MEGWTDFAAMTGGVFGALLGLLFVALSLRLDHLEEHPELRARLAQVMALFAGLIVCAVVFTLPDQPLWALGIELIVTGTLLAAYLLWLDSRARSPHDASFAERVIARISPNIVTASLIVTAGVGSAIGWKALLYCIPLAMVLGLIGGLAAAWVVMLPPEHVEHTDHRESKRPGKHGSTEHHLELRELVEHHEPGAHAEEPHVPKHAAIHEGYQPGSGTRG